MGTISPGNFWQHLASGHLDALRFDFVKSNFFRVVHADGIWISPLGQNFHVSFFNERVSIPQQVTHSINPDGSIGPEQPDLRTGRAAIVREVECDVVMTISTAKFMRDLLDSYIKAVEGQNQPKK
jgi:hypothetical protein